VLHGTRLAINPIFLFRAGRTGCLAWHRIVWYWKRAAGRIPCHLGVSDRTIARRRGIVACTSAKRPVFYHQGSFFSTLSLSQLCCCQGHGCRQQGSRQCLSTSVNDPLRPVGTKVFLRRASTTVIVLFFVFLFLFFITFCVLCFTCYSIFCFTCYGLECHLLNREPMNQSINRSYHRGTVGKSDYSANDILR
jgi:hypothetical protein